MNKGESVNEGENRWNEMKLVTKEKSVEKKTKLEIEGVTCWQCGAVDCGSSLQPATHRVAVALKRVDNEVW